MALEYAQLMCACSLLLVVAFAAGALVVACATAPLLSATDVEASAITAPAATQDLTALIHTSL
jgi:hypothetical protein